MNNTKHTTAAPRLPRAAAQVCLVILLAIPTTAALAGRIVVTDFDDVIDDNDGSCTLREAIRSINGGVPIDGCLLDDTVSANLIALTAGTYSVDLSSGTGEDASLDGDLDITSTVEIRGVAPEYTVIDGDTATSQERVFDIGTGGIHVLLRDLTVMGGHEPTDNGGNIRSQAGDGSSMGGGAAIAKVVIRDGRALGGAGIHAAGSFTTFRSTVENNETVGDDGVGGGIAYVGDLLAVIESDIQNNRAATGAGIYNNGQTFTVTGSRVRGNIAAGGAGPDSGRGGGIASFGGGLIAVSRTLIESNQAEQGGGLYLAGDGGEVTHSAIVNNSASSEGGGLYSAENSEIRHSTLSGNDAPTGGGVYSASPMQTLLDAVTLAGNIGGGGLFNQSGAVLESTLVADNGGGNCLGTAPGAGAYNLDDGDTCAFPTDDDNTPSFVMTDPSLFTYRLSQAKQDAQRAVARSLSELYAARGQTAKTQQYGQLSRAGESP